jgi:hypothetical protein
MASQFASGKIPTLTRKLNAADSTAYMDSDVGVTSGRLYGNNNLQEEWIGFTGVAASGSEFAYTGLTRGLSQTADPSTAGTGFTWLSGQSFALVEMHDQMMNKQRPEPLIFASTAARDSALGADGAATSPWVNVYVTATGLHYNYNLSTGQWESIDTGTVTPNASATVAGKVEIGTQTEVDTPTDTGGTGAIVSVIPSTFQQGLLNRISDKSTAETGTDNTKIMSPLRTKDAISYNLGISQFGTYGWSLYFGDGSDGDVTIGAGTTTLSRDMFYRNLTISAGGILNPAGYKVFVSGTCLINATGKIDRTGAAGGAGGNSSGGSPGAGGAAGAATGAGTLGADAAAGAGGQGAINSLSPGSNGGGGTTVNPSYATGITAANGGLGGSGTTASGSIGTGGTVTQGALYNVVRTIGSVLSWLMFPAATVSSTPPTQLFPTTGQYGGSPSAGGGAGGGGTTMACGGGGGGGGGTGGKIFLATRILNNLGSIVSKGGAAGNGGLGYTAGGSSGGGGGGGGGTGGVIILIYNTLTAIGTVDLSGGAFGTGGTGYDGGTNGSSGIVGATGYQVSIQVT